MSLLINEYPLQILPSLAQTIGLNEAIVLQQLHYWIVNKNNKGYYQDGHKWVYNSYTAWQESNFPFWSIPTIQRIFTSLEEQGLIISTQIASTNRNKYYRINYDKMTQLEAAIISKRYDAQPQNDVVLITETTTENKSAYALSGEPERIPVVYESGEYIEVTESKSIKGNPDQKAMVGALARHLKIDLAIRANGARLGRAAKQLLDANYTTENIETFVDWWKLNDWRWKKDRRLPSPEEVLANIGVLDLKEDREEQAQHDALRKIIEEDMRNRNV